jgi:hypothetical protein
VSRLKSSLSPNDGKFLGFELPTEKKDKVKLYSALGVCGVCAIWLIYFVASHIHFSGPARPMNTPGLRIANELSAKLAERDEFIDTGFAVVTEKPLRFKVTGMVRTPKDMDKLKTFLTEIRPEEDYEVDVMIQGASPPS